MSRTEHDVIIVGGGVNGCGIARDAALRGLRVLLAERNDLAKGASGANTGMIHGGIRYLRYDVKTTKLACTDSGYIQAIAPHLLFRIPFLMPVFEGDVFGRFLLEGAEIFFEAYDAYQPLKRGKPHTRLSKQEVLALEPGLASDVTGAVTMDEWGIDPFRLVVANAEQLVIVTAVAAALASSVATDAWTNSERCIDSPISPAREYPTPDEHPQRRVGVGAQVGGVALERGRIGGLGATEEPRRHCVEPGVHPAETEDLEHRGPVGPVQAGGDRVSRLEWRRGMALLHAPHPVELLQRAHLLQRLDGPARLHPTRGHPLRPRAAAV